MSMRRLYYLANDLRTCELVARSLKEEGISDWNFHVLSRDEIALYQHHIHAAATYHQRDVIYTSERWALAGALIALLVGTVAYVLQPLPWEVSGFSVVLMILVGGLFGAWQGAVAGLSRENYKIAPFREDIAAGRHLVMVDVNEGNRARVREVMTVRFPSVEFRGRDTTFISPFAHPRSEPAPTGR
jgi:hypothetical protein